MDIWHDPLFLAALKKGGAGGTASGDIVTFNAPKAAPLKALTLSIDPVQDLHGYDAPWPGGGGKNKFNIADVAINEFQTVSGNTITKAYSAYNFDLLNGTTGASSLATKKISLAAGAYTISGAVTSDSSIGVRVYTVDSDGVVAETHLVAINANTPYATFTLSESGYITLRYSAREACTVSNIQIEPGSSATPYAPYSNLCPISGWDAVNVWVKPTYDPTANPTATIQLGQTVYGGTVDVLTGVLRVDYRFLNAADVTWRKSGDVVFYAPSDLYTTVSADTPTGRKPLLCNTFSYYSGSSVRDGDIGYGGINNNGNITIRSSAVASTLEDWNDYIANNTVQIVYPLATPLEYTLTAQQLDTLAGQNVVWGDCGAVSLEYAGGGVSTGMMLAAILHEARQ